MTLLVGSAVALAAIGLIPAGAGPMGGANHYFLPAGNETIHNLTGGDFYILLVYNWTPRGSGNWGVFDAAAVTSVGGFLIFGTQASDRIAFYDGAGLINQIAPSNTAGVTVSCLGRSGNYMVGKLNSSTWSSNSIARSSVTVSNVPTRLGYASASGQSFAGYVIEMKAEHATPSQSVCDAAISSARSKMGL